MARLRDQLVRDFRDEYAVCLGRLIQAAAMHTRARRAEHCAFCQRQAQESLLTEAAALHATEEEWQGLAGLGDVLTWLTPEQLRLRDCAVAWAAMFAGAGAGLSLQEFQREVDRRQHALCEGAAGAFL